MAKFGELPEPTQEDRCDQLITALSSQQQYLSGLTVNNIEQEINDLRAKVPGEKLPFTFVTKKIVTEAYALVEDFVNHGKGFNTRAQIPSLFTFWITVDDYLQDPKITAEDFLSAKDKFFQKAIVFVENMKNGSSAEEQTPYEG